VGEPGTELQETVGLVLSTRIEEALRLDAGALLPAESDTAEAANLSTTVPSEQEETVTVIEELEAVEGVKTQPVAVPVLEKSAEVKPLTDLEKARA
jgi:hypothetical protein